MKKIRLSIPEPCHENWDAMTPADKGRICASCQKTVIDFTNMSDRQIAEFFKASHSVCGRLYPEQLNKDIELPKKRIPWVRYFFQFSFPAFLISLKGNAQKGRNILKDTICHSQMLGFVATNPLIEKAADAEIIRGEVVDASGTELSGATVMIKGTNMGTVTHSDGNFELKAKPGETLVISYVGYETKEIIASSSRVIAVLEPASMGEVVLVVGAIVTIKRSKPVPLIQKLVDTTFEKFSVYPSPVYRNSTIKIDFKKLAPGKYILSMIGVSGQIIQSEEINVETKGQATEMKLRDMRAGTYIVQVFNKKTERTYLKKIIVQ